MLTSNPHILGGVTVSVTEHFHLFALVHILSVCTCIIGCMLWITGVVTVNPQGIYHLQMLVLLYGEYNANDVILLILHTCVYA